MTGRSDHPCRDKSHSCATSRHCSQVTELLCCDCGTHVSLFLDRSRAGRQTDPCLGPRLQVPCPDLRTVVVVPGEGCLSDQRLGRREAQEQGPRLHTGPPQQSLRCWPQGGVRGAGSPSPPGKGADEGVVGLQRSHPQVSTARTLRCFRVIFSCREGYPEGSVP